MLGADYEIIEEGLNGRTTELDDPLKPEEGKNGLTYLGPCLNSHDPIDKLILFLGTNDLKERFHKTPEQIAASIEFLINTIQKNVYHEGVAPEIILVCPTIVDESVAGVTDKYLGAEAKSRELGALYKQVAERYSLKFLDLSEHVLPSKRDGYHFEPETHQKVAELLKGLLVW